MEHVSVGGVWSARSSASCPLAVYMNHGFSTDRFTVSRVPLRCAPSDAGVQAPLLAQAVAVGKRSRRGRIVVRYPQVSNTHYTCFYCSTQRVRPPDPQARGPLSLWTEVWPTHPVLTLSLTRIYRYFSIVQYGTCTGKN